MLDQPKNKNEVVERNINSDFAKTRYVCFAPTGWSPFIDQSVDNYDIESDLTVIRKSFNGLITYGTLGALKEIPKVANRLGFERLILGVYNVSDETEIANAIELIRLYPKMICGLCLGNEGLSFKTYTIEDLLRTMSEFRELFPSLWITTSEPIFAWGDERLFANVDFCLPILHPWIHEIFKSEPEMAAMWTIQAAQRLQILSQKIVLIKETGFPADGKLFSFANQNEFWRVLVREIGALTKDVHLAFFEAFDNPLKDSFSAFQYWDCYWGLFNADRSPKPVMEILGSYLRAPTSEIGRGKRAPVDVAVVIAGRNRPEYMLEAIESVLSQTTPVRQLILVNDNSTDPKVDEICRGFLDLPHVSYVHRQLPGSSGTARNAGLALVRSRYVCFLDDDDRFLPTKIQTQFDYLEKNSEIGFVATGASIIGTAGDTYARSGSPEFFPGAPIASMLAFCRIVHSSVMLRTDVLRKHGAYLEKFQGEDWELWCRLLIAGEKLHIIDEVLTDYRRHENNISDSVYLNAAIDNVFRRHLETADARTLRRLVNPGDCSAESAELIKAVIYTIHGLYDRALAVLSGMPSHSAAIARYICYRELGEYNSAEAQIREWAVRENLLDEVQLRLAVHRSKFAPRRPMVGSPALLFEHRLLAHDALAEVRESSELGGRTEAVQLSRYFHQGPKNISIERNLSSEHNDLFFNRVSLTSC